MAKLPLVECRICHTKDIDRNIDPDGKTWIMPSKNYFYHRKCYEDWKHGAPASDEEYKDYIYDFIARDLKVSYDYHMCEAQRKKFLKNDMTNKGIFFALKYFYEIKHGDWEKGHGGLGIVPYIYTDSCTYWANKERKSKGIIAEIERQMRDNIMRPRHTIQKKEIKPRKFEVDFSVLDNLEDEE